jgi:hypothetical protein
MYRIYLKIATFKCYSLSSHQLLIILTYLQILQKEQLMKEKIFLTSIFLAALFHNCATYSQSGWFQQNSGINQPISKISFIDPNTGWCSSSGGFMFSTWGYFIRTTNGGQNWSTVINGGIAFSSFYFIDYNTGWLIGGFANDIGTRSRNIFKTINGGLNWQSQLMDSARGILQSVSFVNSNYGIVVGTTISKGLILRTTNSGANWIIDSLSSANVLNDVYCANINA